MRALRSAWMAALAPLLCAQTANVNDLIATQRKQIETADFRVTGHLVSIDAAGARLSFPITIKARWFPGVLRVLVEIGQPPSVAPGSCANTFCSRCAPTARIQSVIADPGDTAARIAALRQMERSPARSGIQLRGFSRAAILLAGANGGRRSKVRRARLRRDQEHARRRPTEPTTRK